MALDGAEVIDERSPLVQLRGRLDQGPPAAARALRQVDDRGYLDELRPGDMVSIHWSWACDRLSRHSVRELIRCTRRAIDLTNMTL
jgi:hypothetical protein